MENTFVTVLQIAERWGLDAEDARTSVWEELSRFKGPSPHQNRARTRGVLGLSAKQFEKATALREAFDAAEAAKPVKPPARKPVTSTAFQKIKSAAEAGGFMDLRAIGKAWV